MLQNAICKEKVKENSIWKIYYENINGRKDKVVVKIIIVKGFKWIKSSFINNHWIDDHTICWVMISKPTSNFKTTFNFLCIPDDISINSKLKLFQTWAPDRVISVKNRNSIHFFQFKKFNKLFHEWNNNNSLVVLKIRIQFSYTVTHRKIAKMLFLIIKKPGVLNLQFNGMRLHKYMGWKQ